jgi:tRNA A-37 threonylcarbamoyl transferase component Bud32
MTWGEDMILWLAGLIGLICLGTTLLCLAVAGLFALWKSSPAAKPPQQAPAQRVPLDITSRRQALDQEAPDRCPVCGSERTPGAPHGLCPQCLIRVGIEASSPAQSPNSASTAAYVPPLAPPNSQELIAAFPQLEVLDLLGKGGMGAVYKARQPHLDRLVALKVLPPDSARDPAFAERFAREARALARLNHPNIVGVHDFGQSGGVYYLLMEYVDGVNLRQAMKTGRLTPQEALRIVPQLCDALQFAHDEGVVHRDIKPENILLDRRGRVKIADFGLAKLLGPCASDTGLTGTQQVMGTLHYMAPEQVAGARDVDHRADIYSLGVTFYEMLTGELPLGRFPPPSKTAGTDARLDPVVLRTLEREPAARYQHANDVKTEVESIVREPAASRSPARTAAPAYARWVGMPLIVMVALYLVAIWGYTLAWLQDRLSQRDMEVSFWDGVALFGAAFVVMNLIWFIRRRQVAATGSMAAGSSSFEVDSRAAIRHGTADEIRRAGNWLLATGMVVLLIWIPVLPLERAPSNATKAILAVHFWWSLVAGAVIAHAGVCMRQMRGYRWAVAGSIVAMVPGSLGVMLGLPVGVWSLILLCHREVQAEFQRTQWLAKNRQFRAADPSAPQAGRPPETVMHALGWIAGRVLRGSVWPRVLSAPLCLLGAATLFGTWLYVQVDAHLANPPRVVAGRLASFEVYGHQLWQGWAACGTFFVLTGVAIGTLRQRARWPAGVLLIGGAVCAATAALVFTQLPVPPDGPELRQAVQSVHSVFPNVALAGKTDLQVLEEASREHKIVIQKQAANSSVIALVVAAALILLAVLDLSRTVPGPAGPK